MDWKSFFFVCNGKSMGTIFSNLAITCYLLPTLSNDRAYCHCHFCFIQRYLFTFFEWNYRLKIWFFFKNRLHDSYFLWIYWNLSEQVFCKERVSFFSLPVIHISRTWFILAVFAFMVVISFISNVRCRAHSTSDRWRLQ